MIYITYWKTHVIINSDTSDFVRNPIFQKNRISFGFLWTEKPIQHQKHKPWK